MFSTQAAALEIDGWAVDEDGAFGCAACEADKVLAAVASDECVSVGCDLVFSSMVVVAFVDCGRGVSEGGNGAQYCLEGYLLGPESLPHVVQGSQSDLI